MIRIGIVGLGFGERVHVPAFRESGRFDVAALSSKTPGKSSEAARRLGVAKAYDRWIDMVEDSSLAAIAIATPPSDQVEIALSAMRKGKSVFLEKPVSLNEAQAETLEETARSSGVAAMVDFELCEIEEWKLARSLLHQGAIGNLLEISVTWHLQTYAHRQGLDSWKQRTSEGGGVLYQFAPHVFHYLEWFGGPITSLSARFGDERGGSRDAVMHFSAEMLSGAKAQAFLSTNDPSTMSHRIQFHGSAGVLTLDNATSDTARGFKLALMQKDGKMKDHNLVKPPTEEKNRDGRISAVAKLASRFADWMESGASSEPSIIEGRRVQRLLEAAKRSDAAAGQSLRGLTE